MKTKPTHFSKLIAFTVIFGLLVTACYEFDFVDQPHSAGLNSTFQVPISVTMTEGNDLNYIPYFGVRLPVGWTVEDGIPFTSTNNNNGTLNYSLQLSQEMDSIDPAPEGYYWWVAEGSDSVQAIVGDTYLFTPEITTGSQPGTFYLDYMLGPGGSNWWYHYETKLNWRRSDHHLITVGLPDHLVVTNVNDSGPGSLRQAIDSIDYYGTISFELEIEDTIVLEAQLVIEKDVLITGPETDLVTISGNHQCGVFYITGNTAPTLSGLRIVNGQSESGSGIFCGTQSSPVLQNLVLADNHANYHGGGILCEYNVNANLEDVILSGNSAYYGGGICFSSAYEGSGSNPSGSYASRSQMLNVSINDNQAYGGGGIYIGYGASAALQNVNIFNNRAEHGGGIHCYYYSQTELKQVTVCKNYALYNGGGIYYGYYGSLVFDSLERCNIYLNSAMSGNDLYSEGDPVDVIVDTFTVLNPTGFHAVPLDYFTFDILHGKIEQAEADLYVSPDGEDTNSGLTADDPLKTIRMARSRIMADSLHPHTIHLLEGTYSPSANGEIYPVNMIDYVSLSGAFRQGVILDGEGQSGIIRLQDNEGIGISSLSITGGHGSSGGGVYSSNSTFLLEDLTITKNTATGSGGGISLDYYSYADLKNVTVSENSSSYLGGGIYFGYESGITFDNQQRCNIYMNSAQAGNDLYSDYDFHQVVVDTFSVISPTEFHAAPLVYFGFDILHGKTEQVAADLYVSPEGDDNNTGLTADDPLKTIRMARLKILADSLHPRTIHLLEGTYSASSNGEIFPVIMEDYVSLTGQSRGGVILDAEGKSGVIRIDNCLHTELSGMTITGGNFSQGGGVYCIYSSPVMQNLMVSGNSASQGGGLYFSESCYPLLKNVTVTNNTSSDYFGGGGIYFGYYCEPEFDDVMRCNIYLNNAANNPGNDLYAYSYVNVVVDTFTVMHPKNFHAYPLYNFSFDILHGYIPQQNVDLFVSSLGDDSNTGLSEDEPLKTISRAISLTSDDPLNIYSIHVANGLYSPSLTGEPFPIMWQDCLTLTGESEEGTILDAEGQSEVIYLYDISGSTISNITVTGGSNSGIFCYNSNPVLQHLTISGNNGNYGGGITLQYSRGDLQNVRISNNSASQAGGGINMVGSNPSLQQVTVSYNTASSEGGGIYCSDSEPVLKNVTINNNDASQGGGIFFAYNPTPLFDSLDRCNIYFNHAVLGQDLYTSSLTDIIEVIVDTFTVIQPKINHAWPLDRFSFDILHGMIPQVNADLYVSPDGDNNNSGLTEADPLKTIGFALASLFEDSTHFNTIHLAKGTYSPSRTGEVFPLWMGSYIGLDGEAENNTTLDAESLSRVMEFRNVRGAKLTDMKMTNGNSSNDGGGLFFSNSSAILEGVTIRGNTTTTNGGGISCDNGSTPQFLDVEIKDNAAFNNGGGIFCNNHSDFILENSIVKENTADQGAGLFVRMSEPALLHVTIQDNLAEDHGGGIMCTASGITLMSNSTIEGNTADMGGGMYCVSSAPVLDNLIIKENAAIDYGGGIHIASSTPEIRKLTVTGNQAQYGGGIFCKDMEARLENTEISNNFAEDRGGGLYVTHAAPELVNVLLADNSTPLKGGGIYSLSSTPVLKNVTITGNYAGSGGAICSSNSDITIWNSILWNEASEEVFYLTNSFESTLSISFTDIQGGEGAIWTNGNGTVEWGEGNMDAYPQFEGIGEDPYMLVTGSPCIDTGTPDTTGLNLPPWDILFNQRIWDGDGNGVAVVDMGAYEHGSVVVGDEELAVGNGQLAVCVVPNPAFSRTEIHYQLAVGSWQLAKSEMVKLTLNDITGKQVSVFVDDMQAPGEHTVLFDASGLPAGIYVVRLETGDAVATEKMVVMR